ncbi:hypothetical protein FALBO_3915 [Fusarium albosuccineum]|uniref:Uncharacterized protein n=1 Tax=Fusarium albosuccineum TaxID=1237068 RepID=A0A8H4PGT5_9HYPO|nr:hypothetical protein FALBO_3915 [Fusarium albosuccineum]
MLDGWRTKTYTHPCKIPSRTSSETKGIMSRFTAPLLALRTLKGPAGLPKRTRSYKSLYVPIVARMAPPLSQDDNASRAGGSLASSDDIPGFSQGRSHLVPEAVFGVPTRTFPYTSNQPEKNPDLTVWALMRAVAGCSGKVARALPPKQFFIHALSSIKPPLPLVNAPKPVRQLQIRSKPNPMSSGLGSLPYVLNFNSSQNCDAMIRHLYGEERSNGDSCSKCRQDQGGLVGCVVYSDMHANCANCDWNRSGKGCSLTGGGDTTKRQAKRKASESSSSGTVTTIASRSTHSTHNRDESENSDLREMFRGMDPTTLMRLSTLLADAARLDGYF